MSQLNCLSKNGARSGHWIQHNAVSIKPIQRLQCEFRRHTGWERMNGAQLDATFLRVAD
jgi:hypothetical protein